MEIKGSITAKSVITAGLRVNEGLVRAPLISDVVLTKYSEKHLAYYADADHYVTLPDATSLPSGWSVSIYNVSSSVGNITIRSNDNTSLKKVYVNKMCSVILLDNQTAAGVWKIVEAGGGGSGSGSGLRNIVITSTGTVMSLSGTTLSVGHFIASVAQGFDSSGDPIDSSVEITTPVQIQIPSGVASYIYVDEAGLVFYDTHKQLGGEVLPSVTTGFAVGTRFYSISDEQNYQLTSSGWVAAPCVAIGEVDANGTPHVYPFNYWWWFEDNPLIAYSQSFYNATLPTTTVHLNYPVINKDFLVINVGNTVLLQSTYAIGSDNQTITFDHAIEPDINIEVRWFIPRTAIAADTIYTGGTRNLGEVYYSQSAAASDNPGGLPLFTGETISNADQLYPDFYSWIVTHTELQISASNYETALTTYGECPKYVVDTTNKTIRLPLLKNYIKMANIVDGITHHTAGLPNITGNFYAPGDYVFNSGQFTGAFKAGPNVTRRDGATADVQTYPSVDFDASASNSIYGNSDTVTPAHTTLYPWVFAYSAAVPASVAQAAEFQQALTSKADIDFSNIITFTPFANALSPDMSTYSTIATQTTFTALVPGYISFVPSTNTNTSNTINAEYNGYMQIDGKTVLSSSYLQNNDATHPDCAWFFIGTGQTFYHTMTGGTVYFYPIKGV